MRTWITCATLVDRGVDPSQIGEHAACGDDALAGLPHLVVDREDPVVAVGGQLPPRVAVRALSARGPWRPAMRTRRRRCRRRRPRSRRSCPDRSSVMPISTYGLSVKRCAAGRSTPTAASTLPGKLSDAEHPHRGVGELHDRRLEVGGVVVGAGLVGGLLEVVDQPVGGVGASGRRADSAQVVLPRRAGCAGEHRRGDRGQLADTPPASAPASPGSGRGWPP